MRAERFPFSDGEDPTAPPAGYFTPLRIDPTGQRGPTRAEARGRAWRRTSHGFYVPAPPYGPSGDDVLQRILEASVLVPRGGAITGWAGLRWLGGAWFGGRDAAGRPWPVTIMTGTQDIRPQPGIVLSGEGLGPRHVTVHRGVPVTIPAFSVSFLMRYAKSDREAATTLSMACYSDLVSIAEVDALLTPGQNGWTGVPRARRSLPWAEENAWSPLEVRMLHVWALDVGHAWPLANRPVFDRWGRFLATPDLIDPVAGVYGQYDGALHLDRARRDRDIITSAALDEVGLVGVTMTAADLPDTTRFENRLRSAYRRAVAMRRVRGREPDWTLDPPPGWVTTHTVERRRALTPDQAARWLRYRSAS